MMRWLQDPGNWMKWDCCCSSTEKWLFSTIQWNETTGTNTHACIDHESGVLVQKVYGFLWSATLPMHRLHAGKVRAKQNCSTQCLKRWSFFFISRSLCQSLYWCLLRWRARWSDLAKAFSQWGHLNGFIPVCFRMWRVSSSDLANFQVQPSQAVSYTHLTLPTIYSV